MKKFKKEGPKPKSKDKEDISSLYYWGDQKKNINTLLAASWDGNVRLYDDKQSGEEGDWRWTMDRHTNAVNYLDFRLKETLCASSGDDGVIIVFNYNTHRLEGTLKFDNPEYEAPAPVKICKFLEGTDILVSADLDGYIIFWCVTSSAHPQKNKRLCYVRDSSKADVGDDEKPPYFPIRAIDYDPKE
jgi:WD40 repeat protein